MNTNGIFAHFLNAQKSRYGIYFAFYYLFIFYYLILQCIFQTTQPTGGFLALYSLPDSGMLKTQPKHCTSRKWLIARVLPVGKATLARWLSRKSCSPRSWWLPLNSRIYTVGEPTVTLLSCHLTFTCVTWPMAYIQAHPQQINKWMNKI